MHAECPIHVVGIVKLLSSGTKQEQKFRKRIHLGFETLLQRYYLVTREDRHRPIRMEA